MAPHHADRLRLLALLIAVFGRTVALVIIAVQALQVLLGGDYSKYQATTLAAWLGLSAVPALVLSPFAGPLAGSRWNRVLLVGGTVAMVLVLAWTNADPDLPWVSIAGILSLEAAIFWTAALALIPTLATNVRWGRPVVSALVLVAATAGSALGVYLGRDRDAAAAARHALIAGLLGLTGLALARFRLQDPEPLSAGILRSFIDGARDVLRSGPARSALVGLLLWFFVLLGVAVCVVRFAAPVAQGGAAELTIRFLLHVALGILLSALNRNLYRHGGLVVFAAIAVVGICLWLRFGESWTGPVLSLGIALGAAISPLLTTYQTWITPRHYGSAAAMVVAGWCVAALVLAAIVVNLGDDTAATRPPMLTMLLVVAGIGAVGSLLMFFRPALELAAEVVILPFYRINVTGPGVHQLPTRGPCLIIANHAAWFDPLFVAKILPRPVTPMMTSRFYDLPGLSWIMRHITHTIRVPEKALRHEAPELKEAIAALDRGECVVLFPEGYLRRKEEQPIRRFGRGVWQILHDRPETPVFACWIDGNWGSYFSYKGGPPTRNKRFDFWRRIRIAVTGPLKVDPTLLADHMATRTFLMKQVSAAREPLGLEPLAIDRIPDEEKE